MSTFVPSLPCVACMLLRGIVHTHTLPLTLAPLWQKEAIQEEQAQIKNRLATEERIAAGSFSSIREQLREHEADLYTAQQQVKKLSAELDNVPSTAFDPVAATPHFQPHTYPSVVECWEHHRLVRQREEEEEQGRAVRRRVNQHEDSDTEHYVDSDSDQYEEVEVACAQRS